MKTVVRLAAIVCALPALSIAGCGAGGVSSGHNQSGGANANSTIPNPRSIQEADIYKLVGNTLYILSSKRGLEIVDVTDVQSPKLLSTLPTQSSPRQIYVEGETAYVLTSNVNDIDCGGYKGTCGWNAPGGAITQVDVIMSRTPPRRRSSGRSSSREISRTAASWDTSSTWSASTPAAPAPWSRATTSATRARSQRWPRLTSPLVIGTSESF